MQIMLKTSAVLLILAGLPHIALAAPCGTGNATDKYLQVYNNFTDKPVWLTLSGTLPKQAENKWLIGQKIEPQSCFQTIIPKNQWNAGRGYIYETDPAKDADPSSIDGNYQLFEYTYRGENGPTAGSTGTGLNYDYSAVDSLHSALPVALEAANAIDNSDAVPFTGNPTPGEFSSSTDSYNTKFYQGVQKLIDAGWPYFTKSSDPGNYYKIAGGYNLFALSNLGMMTYSPTARQHITPDFLTHKWRMWLDTPPAQMCPDNVQPDQEFCLAFQASVKKVWNGFLANASANSVTNLSDIDIVTHITGFVNFTNTDNPDNSTWTGIDGTSGVDHAWIALASGIPSLDAKYLKHEYPDYDSIYNLDPYVTAIHKNLGLNIYSFSIDDAVGDIDVSTQNKLIVAIGGLNGLPNKEQQQSPQAMLYSSSFGPGWTKVTACGYPFALQTGTGSSTPLLFTGDTCDVTYTGGSPGQALSYTVTLDNEQLIVSTCDDSKAGTSICQGVFTAPDNAKLIVGPALPGSNGGGGDATSFLAYAPGYSNITSSDGNCTLAKPKEGFDTTQGGQLALTVNNKQAQSCIFELHMPDTINPTGAFTVKLNLPGDANAPILLECMQYNDISKSCKAQPTVLTNNGNYQVYLPMAKDL